MINALFEPVSSWISGKPVESLGERRLCERFQIQSHAPLRQIAEPDLLAPDSRTGGSHPVLLLREARSNSLFGSTELVYILFGNRGQYRYTSVHSTYG